MMGPTCLSLFQLNETSCAGGRHNMPRPRWPFDLESGVQVTCDVGYLFANFGLPRRLCSRLRPNIRDRQTSDVRETSDRRQTRIIA